MNHQSNNTIMLQLWSVLACTAFVQSIAPDNAAQIPLLPQSHSQDYKFDALLHLLCVSPYFDAVGSGLDHQAPHGCEVTAVWIISLYNPSVLFSSSNLQFPNVWVLLRHSKLEDFANLLLRLRILLKKYRLRNYLGFLSYSICGNLRQRRRLRTLHGTFHQEARLHLRFLLRKEAKRMGETAILFQEMGKSDWWPRKSNRTSHTTREKGLEESRKTPSIKIPEAHSNDETNIHR